MEIIKPQLIQPSYLPAYPQYRAPADSQSYKITFLVFGLLALIVGLLGLGGVIITLKGLFDSHETITTQDWLFFGIAAVVFVWKVITQITALILVIFNSSTSLKELTGYFGINTAISICLDMFVIALILLVLLTSGHEFHELVKNMLYLALGYSLIYFVLYTIAMLSLLKYIGELPVQYKSVMEEEYYFSNFK